MALERWIVVLHAFAAVAMTGLIWFVQIVHYPLFAAVGEPEFARYEALHVRRTGYVVMPLMLTELVSAGWLVYCPPSPATAWLAYTGFGLLCAIWLSTAWWQIPCHRRLERGRDAVTIDRLVATNWLRTAAWTGRAVLALYLVGEVAGGQ